MLERRKANLQKFEKPVETTNEEWNGAYKRFYDAKRVILAHSAINAASAVARVNVIEGKMFCARALSMFLWSVEDLSPRLGTPRTACQRCG